VEKIEAKGQLAKPCIPTWNR